MQTSSITSKAMDKDITPGGKNSGKNLNEYCVSDPNAKTINTKDLMQKLQKIQGQSFPRPVR